MREVITLAILTLLIGIFYTHESAAQTDNARMEEHIRDLPPEQQEQMRNLMKQMTQDREMTQQLEQQHFEETGMDMEEMYKMMENGDMDRHALVKKIAESYESTGPQACLTREDILASSEEFSETPSETQSDIQEIKTNAYERISFMMEVTPQAFETAWNSCIKKASQQRFKSAICTFMVHAYFSATDEKMIALGNSLITKDDEYQKRCGAQNKQLLKELNFDKPQKGDVLLVTEDGTLFAGERKTPKPFYFMHSLEERKSPTPHFDTAK